MTTSATGPAPVAKAERNCQICGKGIYRCGHDDEGREHWVHVDGYLTCYEGDSIAVAMPY